MQVPDWKVLPSHRIDCLVTLDTNKEKCAQLSGFFEHGDVALKEFVTAAREETKAVVYLVKHVPSAVHVAAECQSVAVECGVIDVLVIT